MQNASGNCPDVGVAEVADAVKAQQTDACVSLSAEHWAETAHACPGGVVPGATHAPFVQVVPVAQVH